MTTPRIRPTSQAVRPEHRSETTQLSHRYGTIGIQAVAAAVRYVERREGPPHTATSASIDQRFVESTR